MAKIFISPSSQWSNAYVIKPYVEAEICNKIADYCQNVLTAAGQECRRNNPKATYAQHVIDSNAFGADIHICIHTNAANGSARGGRVGCYNHQDATKESTKLAQKVYNRLAPVTPGGDSLVTYTFAEVTQTKAKCVYCELSFHDNPDDCRFILDSQELLGKTVALGVLDYLGIEYKEASVPAPDYAGQLNEANATIAAKDAEIAKLTADNVAAQSQIADLQARIVGLIGTNATQMQDLQAVAAAMDSLTFIASKY